MTPTLPLRHADVTAFRDGCILAGYDADSIAVWAELPAAPMPGSDCVICIAHGEFALSFLTADGADWTTRALRAVWEGRCGPRVRHAAAAVEPATPWRERGAPAPPQPQRRLWP